MWQESASTEAFGGGGGLCIFHYSINGILVIKVRVQRALMLESGVELVLVIIESNGGVIEKIHKTFSVSLCFVP